MNMALIPQTCIILLALALIKSSFGIKYQKTESDRQSTSQEITATGLALLYCPLLAFSSNRSQK